MSEKKNVTGDDIKAFFEKNPELKQMFESCVSRGDFKCDCQKIMGRMMKSCCQKPHATKPTESV